MVISSIVFQFVMFTSTTKLRKIKSVEKKRDATSSSRIATVISLITNSEFIRGKSFRLDGLRTRNVIFIPSLSEPGRIKSVREMKYIIVVPS
jgi:hypothetical protein